MTQPHSLRRCERMTLQVHSLGSPPMYFLTASGPKGIPFNALFLPQSWSTMDCLPIDETFHKFYLDRDGGAILVYGRDEKHLV